MKIKAAYLLTAILTLTTTLFGHVVLTNQASNSVVVFKRDQKTGLLTPTEHRLEIERPSIVKFIKAN